MTPPLRTLPAPSGALGRAVVVAAAMLVWSVLAGPVGPASARSASGTAAAGAQFQPPVPVLVLTPFRPPATRYGPGHRGVDLAAPVGTPVRAAGAGTVVFAGPVAGRGVVSIQHASGLRTTYGPVRASIAAGRPVVAGTVIGTVDGGHVACAPAGCLHWGARLADGSYLDPLSLLTGLHVRLLPWSGPADP